MIKKIHYLGIDRKIIKTVRLQRKSLSESLSELRGFSKKPLSHVSHLSLLIIIILVFLSSSFNVSAEKTGGLIDPIGLNKVDKKDKSTDTAADSQITATLASVLKEDLAEDAFNIANERTKSLSLSLSSQEFLANPSLISGGNISGGGDKVRNYTVQDGDTLWSIARANNITTDTIRWANNLTDIDNVKPGSVLIIPSTVGVLHTVRGGETIKGIAARYQASSAQIESYNNIIDEELVPGMKIIVPDGVGAELPKPEPKLEPKNDTRLAKNVDNRSNFKAPFSVASSSGPNRFPYGYCTWWVAHKRYIPWNGNAWQWYGNARAYGVSTGKTPVPGAVMVTWESSVGHVAYVESVSGNSFTISEMNYAGYGRISSRTLSTGSVPLIGFIY